MYMAQNLQDHSFVHFFFFFLTQQKSTDEWQLLQAADIVVDASRPRWTNKVFFLLLVFWDKVQLSDQILISSFTKCAALLVESHETLKRLGGPPSTKVQAKSSSNQSLFVFFYPWRNLTVFKTMFHFHMFFLICWTRRANMIFYLGTKQKSSNAFWNVGMYGKRL